MSSKEEKKGTVGRRAVIKGAAATGLAAAAGTHRFASSAERHTAGRDMIQRENTKPGTRDWLLTKTRTLPGKINKILNNGRCREIEGYCSANSVRAGDTLKVMVSTNPESTFKLEIFRTGYYGGTGARLVKTYPEIQS
ncbi:twin-arginine translocation signal domain-containing protein, partial [Rubripirellula sp.]|nr:twin-arginine translocation signal domain-containing protein [Rubripirellula sp.]